MDLKQANPLGALWMATRNKLITGMFACWTLLWIAHVGLQINWINVSVGLDSCSAAAARPLLGGRRPLRFSGW